MMRRIDGVSNRKMRNVEFIEVLDKKRLRIVFNNSQEIVVRASSEDYGYDEGIYIEKDNV
ncbi:hypothetical protein ACNA6I_01205 [Rossellomorea sp. FS2]|uniref:hypothetical protein n=1 Tax=Rossellomorea sp. FS2 TaxID=3391447 RepID=UPI003A4D9ACD